MKKEKRRNRKAVLHYMEQNINRKHYCLIPCSLLNNEVFNGLPEQLDLNKAKSILYYVAGKITFDNRDSWYRSNPQYKPTPLKAEFLKNILGRNYRSYLDYFVSKGILHQSTYVRGVHSRNYNLESCFHNDKLESVEITDKSISKGILKRKREKHQENLPFYNLYADSLYWFTTDKLQINQTGASSFLGKMKDRHSLRMVAAPDLNSDDIINLTNRVLPTKLSHGENHINDIKNCDYGISIAHKGCRVYTAVTKMMSPLRNFLTYDGQTLAAVDIKNSQPFHFCFILSEKFWSSNRHQCNFQTLENKDDVKKGCSHTNHFKNHPDIKTIRRIVRNQPDDIKKFINLARTGNFYETLVTLFGENYVSFCNRESAKKSMIKFLNFDSKKENFPYYGSYKAFKKEFPNVCTVIDFLKSRYYKDSARILQRLEAKMLLYNVVNKFADEYPDVPVFTIHDSLLTLEDYKGRLIEKINEVYLNVFGFTPQTDGGEILCPENAVSSLDDYLDRKSDSELKIENLSDDYWPLFLKYSYAS